MRKYVVAAAMSLALGVAHPGAANAVLMYNSLTDWQTAVGTWTETTTLGVADGSSVTSATLADGTGLTFAESLTVFSVPATAGRPGAAAITAKFCMDLV